MIPRTIDELRADVARCNARTADWPRCQLCERPYNDNRTEGVPDRCSDCGGTLPHSLHFAGSPVPAKLGSDIQYHGLAGDLQDILENIADRVAEETDT